MDKTELENRAFQAQRFLDDALFQEGVQKLIDHYMKLSIEAPTVEEREEARKYVKVAQGFPGHFQSMINELRYKDINNE